MLVVALLSAVLSIVGVVAPAQADEEEPQTDGTVELVLSLGDHGATTADEPLSGSVTIENGTGDGLTSGRVSLEINRTPLGDQAAVTTWVNSGSAPDAFTTLFSAPTEAVAARTSAETPIFVTADVLQDLPAGVYAVRVSLTGATTGTDATAWDLTARSVITVRSSDAPQVSILVPITATPASGELLTADELSALTAPDGALTAQLDAVEGTTAVLAVDPAIPAAIRVLGTAAPETATAWLDRLETLPNERFALQFGDADATTQAQAGLDALLEPETLETFMDAANFPASTEETPTPPPTPEGGDGEEGDTEEETPELPDLAELTAIDGELEGFLWPRGEVSESDLATFDSFMGGSATTILPSSAASEATGAHAEVGGSSVLLTDTAVSTLLSAAAAETEVSVREPLLAQASASLFFADDSATGLLIGLDRDESRTADALRDVIDTVGAVPLQALQESTAVSVSLTTQPSSERAAQLTTLLEDEERLGDFATILEDPQLLLAPERIRLLRVIGVGVSDADYESAYAEHREETTDTLNAVSLQESGPIQLFSANVSLPVWIRNDLPWPVTLRLEVRPSDPRIVIEAYTDVEALAENNTRVQIPVQSRVASGELQVRFSLTSPTGVPIGQSETTNVTVRAEWENIGLGVLGGVIAVLLVFGVVRTVRRRRRETSAAEAAASAEEER